MNGRIFEPVNEYAALEKRILTDTFHTGRFAARCLLYEAADFFVCSPGQCIGAVAILEPSLQTNEQRSSVREAQLYFAHCRWRVAGQEPTVGVLGAEDEWRPRFDRRFAKPDGTAEFAQSQTHDRFTSEPLLRIVRNRKVRTRQMRRESTPHPCQRSRCGSIRASARDCVGTLSMTSTDPRTNLGLSWRGSGIANNGVDPAT